jgi:hypothetical protein
VLHEPPMDNWASAGARWPARWTWSSRSRSDGLPTQPAASPPGKAPSPRSRTGRKRQRRSIILA